MRKLYILLLLSISITAKAQPYRPLLASINEWIYTTSIMPVSQPQRMASTSCMWQFVTANMKYMTVGDTMISGMNYHRLFADVAGTGQLCHQGYIREDTVIRRVYFMEPSLIPERLLYDFSMQPGDSIYVSSGGQFDYITTGYYYLDSITNYPMISGSTKAFYLHNPMAQPFSAPLIWLEGVGFPGELVYDMITFPGGGTFGMCQSFTSNWYNYPKILTCFSHDNKVYFDSCAYAFALQFTGCFIVNDSCNYYNVCGSVSELNSVSNIQVQPNPVKNEVAVSFDVTANDEIQIKITDINGRPTGLIHSLKIKPGNTVSKFDVAGLSAGIYLVNITGKNGSKAARMIKY